MIKIRKILSFNPGIRLVLLSALYLILPAAIKIFIPKTSIFALVLFYSICAIVAVYYLRKINGIRLNFEHKSSAVEEKINIVKDLNMREHNKNLALREKIRRYGKLKQVIEEINQNLSLDVMGESLVNIASTLVANQKGVCVLYLVDEKTQKIRLFKSRKERSELVIKEKEGDIFDWWVLRQVKPLLVEDARKDFRFDAGRLKHPDARLLRSIISVPLVLEHRFLGILRLDHEEPQAYSQDDLRLLMTIADIGAVALENSELYQRTRDLAIHDGLTSLYTKAYFMERLSEELRRSLGHKLNFSCLMLDVDHFKEYNDTYGHTAGDVVLKNISSCMLEVFLPQSGIIARFGGEEFVVILPSIDKKKALDLADALRVAIEKKKIILRRKETTVTVSIGVASFPEDASSEDELIFKADQAMYVAKKNGRNRVQGS